MQPFSDGGRDESNGLGVIGFDEIKDAVNRSFEDDPGLEYRYWVASKLRDGGAMIYHYGLDPDFVDRVDSDWKEWYHRLQRPFLKHNPVWMANF